MASTTAIGDLRERVELQILTTSRDSIGGLVESWSALVTVWARVAPMSAGEQFRRQQMQASAQWRVTIRYRADVTTKMRVVWGSRVFQVRGAPSPDERK